MPYQKPKIMAKKDDSEWKDQFIPQISFEQIRKQGSFNDQ